MKLARLFVVGVVAASLFVAFVVDAGERPGPDNALTVAQSTSVPVVSANGNVWFCPGGSVEGGAADVSLELINIGDTVATAVVSGVRSGSGAEPREITEVVEPGERQIVRLAELVADSAWAGAVVEVTNGALVVEQTFVGLLGSDRAPCHTSTSTSWISAAGATRDSEFGEVLTLLVLNPFLDDAVLDINFDSDVGVDSLTGVVVPARRVVAVDVTAAVTVAARVSAFIDVRTGRVAISRLQQIDNESQTGVVVTPASGSVAPVWYLPVVHRGDRDDVITVVNPSPTETAEVDLEIVADGDATLDPILLTVRPGRSVSVDLAAETRLEGVSSLSIVARSLTGLPIAVMSESSLSLGDGRVSNLSATSGSDAAALRWIAPMASDEGGIVIYNPSATSIATVTLSTLGPDGSATPLPSIELAPQSRARVASADLGDDRPIVLVDAAEPVVVGREFSGVSSHAQLMAIAMTEVEPLG